jgi:hypothetical protein
MCTFEKYFTRKTIALTQMLCLKVVAIHSENYISDASKAQTIA